MRTALIAACIIGGVSSADVLKWPSDAARQLGEHATAIHKQAQKTHDAAAYEQAHKLYQEYLAKYSDLPDANLSFYDAELLFHLQRYDEAARMYERATTIAPHGKFARDAAYGLVIATKNAATHNPEAPDAGAPCPDMKPCPIPPDMQRLVSAFDKYLALVPESSETLSIYYRKARVYYDYQHFAEAAPLFDHIFTKAPEHELATYSANLEMDCLTMLKRYDELRALVERVKKSPAIKDSATQQQVRSVEAGLKKRGK